MSFLQQSSHILKNLFKTVTDVKGEYVFNLKKKKKIKHKNKPVKMGH